MKSCSSTRAGRKPISRSLAPSPTLEADLLAHARARLAGYKVPRSVDFERELPRTTAGKLALRRLRDRYWKDLDRRI